MSNPQDLDQSGNARELFKAYLGPTLGWIYTALNAVQSVTATGTTNIGQGITTVAVNVNADGVVIQLPSAIPNVNLVGPWSGTPILIADTGGHAGTHTITILPFGTEKIMGLNSLTISNDYGSWTLVPNVGTGGWAQG